MFNWCVKQDPREETLVYEWMTTTLESLYVAVGILIFLTLFCKHPDKGEFPEKKKSTTQMYAPKKHLLTQRVKSNTSFQYLLC